MSKTLVGRTLESKVTGIHGAAAQAASVAAIAVAFLLVPGTATGQDESMPTANDGERVIAARIAGVPVSPGHPWLKPDYRECVRLDSFVSNGTESVESLGISHYVMKFQMTVSYLDDCIWSFSVLEEFDSRAHARVHAEALAAAAAGMDVLRLDLISPGYHKSEEGTQAVLSGEVVFQQAGDGWRVAGIRDSAFGWKESATEASDDGGSGP